MNSDQRRKWVPAVAVPAVVGALALGGGISANADTDLPDKTAEEVLALAAGHETHSFSGTFEASFALGLPQLPGADGDSGSGPFRHGDHEGEDEGDDGAARGQAKLAEVFDLLSGTHEARVFVDGKDKARLQVFEGTDERNVIRNGDDVWVYDSAENTAAHATLPEHGADGHGLSPRNRGGGVLPGETQTPDELAARFLEKIDPSTEVTVEQDTRVAGRDAYTLRLDPRTGDTLVEDVTLAVDAATGTALSVQVNAVGQEDPAISVGFTSFTPEAPDASLFEFTPPEGATVEEHEAPDHEAKREHHGDAKDAGHGDAAVEHGSGWDAVVVIPADEVPEDLAASPLVEQYATDTDAGKVLSTPLATVLIAEDGRVLAGAVPVERLLDVAGTE